MFSTLSNPLGLLFVIIVLIGGQSQALNVVLTNDDGWATANIRAQFDALNSAGFNVVLSAPANDMSNTGSSDATPTPLSPLGTGCEFGTCPPGSPATGTDANDGRINYVNSFPATASRFGINTFGPPFFGCVRPDFVVAGPNVGVFLGTAGVAASGVLGSACEGAVEGIPAVAFSGSGSAQVSFTTLNQTTLLSSITARTHSALGLLFTEALTAPTFSACTPILPYGIALHVNFPPAIGNCADPSAVKFVLSRIATATSATPADFNICGSTFLPTETAINVTAGCFASVSLVDCVHNKADASAALQQEVVNRLGQPFFTCI